MGSIFLQSFSHLKLTQCERISGAWWGKPCPSCVWNSLFSIHGIEVGDGFPGTCASRCLHPSRIWWLWTWIWIGGLLGYPQLCKQLLISTSRHSRVDFFSHLVTMNKLFSMGSAYLQSFIARHFCSGFGIHSHFKVDDNVVQLPLLCSFYLKKDVVPYLAFQGN